MKCNKAQEWISLQMDSQLPAEHVPLLQKHIASCAVCRSYCDDALVGHRFLAATEPVPPDHFDWKLQLRLNQAMREAAKDVKFPWLRPQDRWRRWFSRAGFSAAMGLAAILMLSMILPARTLFMPVHEPQQAEDTDRSARLPFKISDQRLALFESNRRPLDAPFLPAIRPQGFGIQHQTSAVGALRQKNWLIANSEHDLLRIRQLEQNVEALRRLLIVRDRQIQLLEAKLDSLKQLPVDTHKEN